VEVVLISSYRILSSMFPDLDKDVIDDVVRLKEGRLVYQDLLAGTYADFVSTHPESVWLSMPALL